MSKLSSVLRQATGGVIMFWCPGCDSAHGLRIGTPSGGKGPAAWTYNGDPVKPTFRPSVLVTMPDPDRPGVNLEVCHSYVTEGRIQFLGDCTHQYAGATLDLPDWPWDDEADQAPENGDAS